jgi:hypothetical protein
MYVCVQIELVNIEVVRFGIGDDEAANKESFGKDVKDGNLTLEDSELVSEKERLHELLPQQEGHALAIARSKQNMMAVPRGTHAENCRQSSLVARPGTWYHARYEAALRGSLAAGALLRYRLETPVL